MAKTWKPRRVTDPEERNTGSAGYIQLDEGQRFTGYALFDGDPTTDEPGYYEFFEHWVQGPKGRSVPCAGEDCPLCEDGDRPRVRAKTLWLVTKDEKGHDLDDGELRTFNFNKYVIDQFTELRAEGEKIKGRLFRISRVDDRGNYMVMPKPDKKTAAEVKELLKSKEAPDYDQMITGQLRRAMEGLAIARAMDDDDDEDEKPKRTNKKAKAADDDEDEEEEKPAKGKSKKAAKAAEPEEWPEEGEDITAEVAKVGTKADPNTLEVTSEDFDGKVVVWGTDKIDVTELSKGDSIVISYETDADDDKVLSVMEAAEAEEPEDEEEAGDKTAGDDLPDTIEEEEFEVTEIDEENQTIDVKSDDLDIAFTLYFLDKGPASKVDFDDYTVGDTIIVSAEKDRQDDMVATVVPEVKKAKSKGKKKKAAA